MATTFKDNWIKALAGIAMSDQRFYHEDECVFFADHVECAEGCLAGPANDALNEIAEAMNTGGGIVVGEDYDETKPA